MSVDAAAERKALEAKDREELQQIITALGGKTTSRMRKATMIDQILELTGVVAGGEGDSSDAGEASDSDATSGDEGGSKTDAAEADEDADDSAESGDDESSNSGRGGQKGGGDKGGDARESGQKSEQQSDQKSGGQQSDQKSGDQKSGDQKSGDQQSGDDDEDGNRRRRRRGRNRDNANNQQQEEFTGDPIPVAGYLDLRNDGYGFLRVAGFLPSRQDVYVSVKQTRQFGLRDGDHVEGASRPAFRNEKNPAMLRIDKVNGGDPEAGPDRPRFVDLTPVLPDERYTLEQADDPTALTARAVDILCPIGKGQRGVVLSPPKSGKTSVLIDIAAAINANDPDAEVLVVLVDERPEEVTHVTRSLPNSEVIASTFDRPADEHTRMVELVLSRAERAVEAGRDVVLLIDGLTRLVRAYNIAGQSSGKSLPGGLDLAALHPAKKFFGAARNTEEAGSLTILATVAVENGSELDATIAEEFAGAANMELKLDRHMATRRVFPAIDVDASSTRQEALLIPVDQMPQVETLRRILTELPKEGSGGEAGRPTERLLERLLATKSNEAFLDDIANGGSL